jgi:FkbM family methyltransferase
MLNWIFIRQVGLGRWATFYFARQFSKRILRRDNRMRLPTGSAIVLPRASKNSTEVYVTRGDMDWGSEALLARFADRSRDFLDIGAHIGYYSSYLSPVVRRVYAFEPHPGHIRALRTNAGIAGNVEVVETAVSSRDGTGSLHLCRTSELSSLDRKDGRTIEVPITTIDRFVAAHPEIDAAAVKTDIEGHDLHALRGMAGTVARCQPLILSECGDAEGLAALCSDWGYSAYAFTRERLVSKPRLLKLDLPNGLRDTPHKMIFLVPARLKEAFAALCGKASKVPDRRGSRGG